MDQSSTMVLFSVLLVTLSSAFTVKNYLVLILLIIAQLRLSLAVKLIGNLATVDMQVHAVVFLKQFL